MSSQKKNTPFAPRFLFGLLSLLALAVDAQPTKESLDLAGAEVREPMRGSDIQQRRALLRASLKSQSEAAAGRDAPANPSRLLSAQERADLRQQLRQQ
jgi:hypothetical protein